MSDKQTTAFLLIVIVAFLFWLYNQKTNGGASNKLADTITSITHPTAAPAPTTPTGLTATQGTTQSTSTSTSNQYAALIAALTGNPNGNYTASNPLNDVSSLNTAISPDDEFTAGYGSGYTA